MLYPAGDTAPSAVPGWLCLELHASSMASLFCNDTASLLQVTSQKGTSPTARQAEPACGMQDATTSAREIRNHQHPLQKQCSRQSLEKETGKEEKKMCKVTDLQASS